MFGLGTEANSGGRGGRSDGRGGGRGDGTGRGKYSGPVPAAATPPSPSGAWAGGGQGTLNGFVTTHDQRVGAHMEVMEALIQQETQNRDVLQAVMERMVNAAGDVNMLARQWQDGQAETASRILALVLEAKDYITTDGRYVPPGAGGAPRGLGEHVPLGGGASGPAGAGEAAAAAAAAAAATAAAVAAAAEVAVGAAGVAAGPAVPKAPVVGAAHGVGEVNAFDGMKIRCAPQQEGTPENALSYFSGEQESSEPSSAPSPEKDNGSSGFLVAGVMPADFLHTLRLQVMAVTKKDRVHLHEMQQAIAAVVVDQFRRTCANEGVVMKPKDVEVGFAPEFYRLLHNPRNAVAAQRTITIEAPDYSQQLAKVLEDKPGVFSMQLAGGFLFRLDKKAEETRSMPVHIELNMTGLNRDLIKLTVDFLKTGGIGCSTVEAAKEYGEGGQSSHMSFQATAEAMYFPDCRHARTSEGSFKILPRNEWSQDRRGRQRFLRVPAKLGKEQVYRSVYIPCWMTLTEPGDRPQTRLALRGERGDIDELPEWRRRVEIEEEQERAQTAMQAARDEEAREVFRAMEAEEEEARQKLSAAEREQKKQEQKKLQLADTARRAEERANKLREAEAERIVRESAQAALKLRRAEANREAIAAAEQRAAEEKQAMEKAMAENAAMAKEHKGLGSERQLRLMAVSARLIQRRTDLKALVPAFTAHKAALKLAAAAGGGVRGGDEGAEGKEGGEPHPSPLTLPGTQIDPPDADPGEPPSAPSSPGGSKPMKRNLRSKAAAPAVVS